MITDREIKKLDKKYANLIRIWVDYDDWEMAHSEVDKLLCKLLMELGATETVREYDKVHKLCA